MPCIRLDLASLRTEQALHAALKQALGFPDFYGANFAALVDCLSGLRYPDEGMIAVALGPDEVLTLHVLNLSAAAKPVIDLLLCAVEDVNTRELQRGRSPSMGLMLARRSAERAGGVDPAGFAR